METVATARRIGAAVVLFHAGTAKAPGEVGGNRAARLWGCDSALMKTLIAAALFALAIASNAQTLKWTNTPPQAFQNASGNFQHLRSDVAGNCAGLLIYSNNIGTTVGVQVVWYSAAGKLLNSDVISGVFSDGQVMSVTASSLVVFWVNQNGDYVIRKYTRRGVAVTSTDKILGSDDFLMASSQPSDQADKLGFIAYSSISTTIKRFTYR